MHLNDALAREPRITPVPLFHEQSAGIAAGITPEAMSPRLACAW